MLFPALVEIRRLGRTLKQRAADILAFFDRPSTSNGPTEAINGRLEHLRGSALGFRNLTTTSPDHCSRPADSGRDYTLDREEPHYRPRADRAIHRREITSSRSLSISRSVVHVSNADEGITLVRLQSPPVNSWTPEFIDGAAKLMMYTAQPVTGEEALRLGLVDHVSEDVLDASRDIAIQIAKNSPRAVRSVKRCVDDGLDTDLTDGLRVERALWVDLIPSGDLQEGASSFFEQRPPAYPDPLSTRAKNHPG